MGSQWGPTGGQGRMSTRYQRQHMLDGSTSSYSREVRSASCGPPSDRTWLLAKRHQMFLHGWYSNKVWDGPFQYVQVPQQCTCPLLSPPTIPKPLPLTQQQQ